MCRNLLNELGVLLPSWWNPYKVTFSTVDKLNISQLRQEIPDT
jgi:hypothetical protein